MCYYSHHCEGGNRCEFSVCLGFYTTVASFISLDFLYSRLEMAPSKLTIRVQKLSAKCYSVKRFFNAFFFLNISWEFGHATVCWSGVLLSRMQTYTGSWVLHSIVGLNVALLIFQQIRMVVFLGKNRVMRFNEDNIWLWMFPEVLCWCENQSFLYRLTRK